jgi:hypothetical protein
MKILILTTYPIKHNDNNIILEQCNDRYQIYSHLLGKYLKSLGNTIIYEKLIRTGNNSITYRLTTKLKYPNCDHAILIDKSGFENRCVKYIDVIRKYISGLVVVITRSSVYKRGEDILFHFSPNGYINRKGRILLNWINDETIIQCKKQPNTINILINNRSLKNDLHYKQKDKYDYVKDKIQQFQIQNNNVIDINFNELFFNDNQFKIQTVGTKSDNRLYPLIDLYKVLSITNIYFVTHRHVDDLLLSDLAFANVIIVAPICYLHPKTVQLFNIITYRNNIIPWTLIFKRLNDNNIRNINVHGIILFL